MDGRMLFNSAISRHHPHIWTFLSCLLDEQASVEILHQQAIVGRRTRRVNKKYVHGDSKTTEHHQRAL